MNEQNEVIAGVRSDQRISATLANVTLDYMTSEGSKAFAATHPPDLPSHLICF